MMTFNRTIEELKLGNNAGRYIGSGTFNRTIEELKFTCYKELHQSTNPFNRTIEELKYTMYDANSTFHSLLIAPLRN